MTSRRIGDISRAEALGEETLKDVQGTSLDKGVELDALSKLPQEERQEIVNDAKAGKPVSARSSVKVEGPNKDEMQGFNNLLRAWANASEDSRQAFMQRIGLEFEERENADSQKDTEIS